jgi:hypothetical protein
MTCSCYSNSTPEPVAVTVNNNTYNVSLGDNAVKWVDLVFARSDSSSGEGYIFFIRELIDAAWVDYEIIDHREQLAFVDNVAQTPATYTVDPAAGAFITLLEALEDGSYLRVHVLVKEI